MPTGRFAAVDIPATTYTTVYAPAAYDQGNATDGYARYTASGILSINNRSGSTVTVRVAIVASNTTNPTPGNAEFIEFDFPLGANQTLERTGLVFAGANTAGASPFTVGQQVVMYASGVGVSAVMYGYEELI